MSELAIFGGPPTRGTKIPAVFYATPETKRRLNGLVTGSALSDFYGAPICQEFERAFAEYFAVGHAIAVNSGTAALHTAVTACGILPGDEVLIPTSCFFGAATVVYQQNAVPVLVDCLDETLEIDLEHAERLITSRTRAIMAVHMYGHPNDIVAIAAFAERRGLRLIEDACQSHGATVDGRYTGTFGDVGCFSFGSPRKHMAVGEGGMVITDDPELAVRARQIANKGKDNGWYTHKIMGFSYTMPEFSALVGLQGLAQLEEQIALRQRVSAAYDSVFAGTEIEVETLSPNKTHTYFRKVIRIPHGYEAVRDWMVRAIEAERVSAKPPHAALHTIEWIANGTPYGTGCPHSCCGRHDLPDPRSFPVADAALSRIIDLETGPGMTEDDAFVSAEAVLKVWNWISGNAAEAERLAAHAGRY